MKHETKNDAVNHPAYYNSHPSGIECIEIVRHCCFNVGNAIKYLWRAGLKGDAIEDLKKARFYIDDEIALRISNAATNDARQSASRPDCSPNA